MNRRIGIIIAFLLASSLVFEARAQEPTWLQPSPQEAKDGSALRVGDDAPAFSLHTYNEDVALRLTKSPLVSLSFFVGLRPEYSRQVVLLGFFKASDKESQGDLALFQKLYKKFKDDGVLVLMISLDNKDTQSVYKVIDSEKIGFPVLRDRFGVVARRYDIVKLPTLLIIDKDGKIVSIGEGYKGDVEGYLEREIRTLLSGG